MMHPSLATIPTPPHLAPWVPPVRTRSVGVRFELGQIAPEPVPPVVYRNPEDYAHLMTPRYEPEPCPDCGETFTRRATNHVRCKPCGRAKLKAERAERWIRDRDAHHAGQLGRRSAA